MHMRETTSPSTEESHSHKLTLSAVWPINLIQDFPLKSKYSVLYIFCAWLNLWRSITNFNEPTSKYLGPWLASHVYKLFIESFIDLLLLKHHFNFMKFKCLKCGNLTFMATFPSEYSQAAWTEVRAKVKLHNNHNNSISQFWIIEGFQCVLQILINVATEWSVYC